MHKPSKLSTEPSGPKVDADRDADTPAVWNELWLCILEAQAGGALQWLRYAQGEGWLLTHKVCARAAALFALYKPMLDARSRQRCDPQAVPWVIAQMGQSLDGFIATTTGDSFFVNGKPCLHHLHRLRALCDAVLVGAGTVAVDNPQLTTRRVPGPQPTRVILDPAVRLDGQAQVFQDGRAKTLWVCDSRHAPRARNHLSQTSACEILSLDGLLDSDLSTHYHPKRVVQALSERGLRLLFVEGGGITVSRFFTAHALDRLHLAIAPVFIGQGRRGLQVQAHKVMADCLRPPARFLALGSDMLWDMDVGMDWRSPST
jgi:riboflavin-specific deaminase-like protein